MELSLRYHNCNEKYVLIKDGENEFVFKLGITKKDMEYLANHKDIEFIDFSKMGTMEKEKLVNEGGF